MTEWTKSSFCESGTCIEAVPIGGWVSVRLSQAQWQALMATRAEWDAFVAGVKAGEFDFPEPHGSHH